MVSVVTLMIRIIFASLDVHLNDLQPTVLVMETDVVTSPTKKSLQV